MRLIFSMKSIFVVHMLINVCPDPVPAVVKVFFLEYHIDGQPLVLDELKGLPACSEKLLLESKWTFITQEVLFSYSFVLIYLNLISPCFRYIRR